MGQRLKLLVLSVLVFTFVGVVPSLDAARAADCGASDWVSGSCPPSVSNDGSEVTLGGETTKPGDAPSGPSKSAGGDASTTAGPVLPPIVRDEYTATMPVTIDDVAKFRPNPGVDLMQPNGWMIVGLSTNFYAHANQHIKTGELLDQPAFVRFTPSRYFWEYGDGGVRTSFSPGATWAAQHVTEFDATPTSHIYRAPGRYVIDLTIGYSAEYRLGSSTDWIPVSGLVWVPANRLVAVASGGAKTVLVEDECTINPFGPGC